MFRRAVITLALTAVSLSCYLGASNSQNVGAGTLWCAIASPMSGAQISGKATVFPIGVAPYGLKSFNLLVDNVLSGTVTTGGKTGTYFTWRPKTKGQHTLRVRINDETGASYTSDPVTVTAT